MRTTAPDGFDPETFYKGIYLFQSWEVFPGLKTRGPKDVVGTLAAMDFPADLSGKRVLDIAPWNGFFSFECARRGAAEVVALGPEDPSDTGFEQTRALLELDNIRYIRGTVYELGPQMAGEFDIVLFLGLIYHLRHPLLALDVIHNVCRDQLYVDTPFIDNKVWDNDLPESLKTALVDAGRPLHQHLPLLYFTKGNETGDYFNWFMPNLRAFRDMVESSGFIVRREANDGGGWCWLAATKSERSFVPSYEGYNPGAAKMPG